jgi:hypothetical protein
MSENRTIQLSRQVLSMFREYRGRRSVNAVAAFDAAQIAILNIAQALRGLVPDEEIIQAVGNEVSPNAVSQALRTKLSFR